MNESRAYALPRPMGKFWAMVRLPRDGKAKPVMEWCKVSKEHKPKRFSDAYSAQKAATERVLAYFNGNMRRDGDTLLGARKEAESLFRGDAT